MSSDFNLVFERNTDLPVEKIWKGWTDPETLMKWFCPRPWKVTECRIDLRPGGEFFTLMQSPEGETFPNNGCFLEIAPFKKLVWTNMLMKNYQPVVDEKMGFPFVVKLTLSDTSKGVYYHAVVSHADEAGMKQHEAMGFQEGWGIAFNQLCELNF